MYAISTRDLTRTFGKVTAVHQLNLKVPDSSLFGLIGPNGAGKTTTLRMLAGLLEPTSGEIRINELSTRKYWRDIQWQIGFMPDFFGVYEDLLVWEYLDFFGRCYGLAPTRRRQVIDELLELVDLTEKRDAYVQNLSRGMRQRLCLAHALVHDPKVLLLDEPASGLDPRARVEMRELLRELRLMGKTILLSSHILTELAELCDSVGIIERGQLVFSGTLDQIRGRTGGNRMLRLQVLSNIEHAEALLSSYPGIHDVFRPEKPGSPGAPGPNGNGTISSSGNGADRLEIEFSGDDSAAADLLDALVKRGVRIAFFGEEITDLEEAFLRMTKGDLA
jgi:ABC-2 type transport system ATP-binding protein